MKKVGLLLGMVVLLLATNALAFTINFEWNRNTETDMGHYTMYQSTAADMSGKVSAGSIAQPVSGTTVQWSYVFTPPAGTEVTYYYAVTALDTTGNESGISNIVSTRVDNKAPAIPTGPLHILGVLP